MYILFINIVYLAMVYDDILCTHSVPTTIIWRQMNYCSQNHKQNHIIMLEADRNFACVIRHLILTPHLDLCFVDEFTVLNKTSNTFEYVTKWLFEYFLCQFFIYLVKHNSLVRKKWTPNSFKYPFSVDHFPLFYQGRSSLTGFFVFIVF